MKEFGFGRDARLLTPADFRHVFDNTCWRGSTPQLLLLASESQEAGPRLGFVLAKKQVRLAVHRNRIKRLVRESFRLNRARIPPLDYVILARGGVSELDNTEIRAMIDALWFRLKRPRPHGRSGHHKNRNGKK